jgi:hypothetical protein
MWRHGGWGIDEVDDDAWVVIVLAFEKDWDTAHQFG